jgi:uncharacterized RDD family membrane protein YckC
MASADYSVLTPERVSVQYDIAGIGSRGAAAMVDTFVQVAALVVLMMALVAVSAVNGLVGLEDDFVQGILLVFFSLGLFIVTVGYFPLFEIVWSGQTPGKRLLGVRVIRENGYPIRPVDAVIRNLVRIVDWLPFFYGVGVLTMLLNRRSKRLGDFASGTIVVREGARMPSLLTPTAISESAPDLVRGPSLASGDATLVRDFLSRRASMHPEARAHLAHRLASALAQRYSVPLGADPETFLERLAA